MVYFRSIRKIIFFQSLLFLIGFLNLTEQTYVKNKQETIGKEFGVSTYQNSSSGHILYLESNYDSSIRDWTSDLWVMDSNGGDKHLIIKNVSSSADWSVDGKKFAVGVLDENGNEILTILDATKTLESCLGKAETVVCQQVILGEYDVPEELGIIQINEVSWFADGERILVSSQCVLNTMKPELWDCYFAKNTLYADVSPLTDEIIMSGLWTYSLETGLLTKFGQFTGTRPEWAPDGTKMAFLYYQSDIGELNYQTNESKGIMQMSFTENGPEYAVLYSPRPDDKDNPLYNFTLDLGIYRKMSWSPDGRYLAFSAEQYDYLIYRLDTATGEIVLLTEVVDEQNIKRDYLAPAWGP